jgi:hypothetical protein
MVPASPESLVDSATASKDLTSKGVVAHRQTAEPKEMTQLTPPLTSSSPPRLPKKQHALFREVLDLLEKQRIPFAVSGAFALRQHTGIGRDTKDLDLFLCAKDAEIALTHLKKNGFRCETCDPVWLFKVHRDGYFVDLITGMSNGVITVEASWIKGAQRGKVLGVSTRVLAPEELILSKLFVTRRERFDGADIAHVIFARGRTLDWERMLAQVGEHWEVLLWALILFRYVYPAYSDHVPRSVWEDLLTRLMSAVARPNPKADFRGSLIDDCMFAIDVKEWGLKDLLSEYRETRLQNTANSAVGPLP